MLTPRVTIRSERPCVSEVHYHPSLRKKTMLTHHKLISYEQISPRLDAPARQDFLRVSPAIPHPRVASLAIRDPTEHDQSPACEVTRDPRSTREPAIHHPRVWSHLAIRDQPHPRTREARGFTRDPRSTNRAHPTSG